MVNYAFRLLLSGRPVLECPATASLSSPPLLPPLCFGAAAACASLSLPSASLSLQGLNLLQPSLKRRLV